MYEKFRALERTVYKIVTSFCIRSPLQGAKLATSTNNFTQLLNVISDSMLHIFTQLLNVISDFMLRIFLLNSRI